MICPPVRESFGRLHGWRVVGCPECDAGPGRRPCCCRGRGCARSAVRDRLPVPGARAGDLVHSLDATEQLRFAARLRGLRPDPAEVARLLELLGLGHRARHLPVQLSGGEQQRLAVACSVVGRPSIVIADEPTAELDSASADRVLGAFADLRGEGVAFVVSSHDPRVVDRTDHLLRLDRGRPVESW